MRLTVELMVPFPGSPSIPPIKAVAVDTSAWKFVTAQEEGQIFFRTKLQGSLILEGQDYKWLHNVWSSESCCLEVTVHVFRPTCRGSVKPDQLFWRGSFKIDAVRWNHSDCSCEVREIQVLDGYEALYRLWTKEVNILQTSRFSFTADYPTYRYWDVDANGNNVEKIPADTEDHIRHTYKNAIRLMEMIWTVARQTTFDSELKPILDGVVFEDVSKFFMAAVNPVTKRENGLKNVLALTASDAKRPAALTPASKLNISLKELLEELRALFNAWWEIDPVTGKFRIEHRSFWPRRSYGAGNTVSLDLRKYPDSLKRANNESVDLDELYGEEVLDIPLNRQDLTRSEFAHFYYGDIGKFPGFPSVFFDRGNLRYADGCVTKNDRGEVQKNTMAANRFFTDILSAYLRPDDIPDASILLVEVSTYPVPNPTALPFVLSRELKTFYVGSNSVINADLSAANLMFDYHRHNLSYWSGEMNYFRNDSRDVTTKPAIENTPGLFFRAVSLKKTRKQEAIEIPICCDDLPLNLNGFIKTQLISQGELAQGTFDPSTDTVTLDLWGESRCTGEEETESDPAEGCPPLGTFIRQYDLTLPVFGPLPDIKITYGVYADGACGEVRHVISRG